MNYTVTIINLEPHELDPKYVVRAMTAETLEDENGTGYYGVPESCVVDGTTATLTMRDALPELAARMDGKVYDGLRD